ncbi:TPA: hypothetical protein N0F65_005112 [Lagenidium giganteum]|uniref:Phospholipid-transporting ATPase n=1 Tax=Lagenidium giganteum TaxID=4803 RepID=A0AAV2Z9J7_9STRA|nr:TPA: hypothetical protein N0F65_005112 [Lagenidium giganteum]
MPRQARSARVGPGIASERTRTFPQQQQQQQQQRRRRRKKQPKHGLRMGNETDGEPAIAPRLAYLNNREKNREVISTQGYARNVIVTSKYTAISFVPKTIFEFFRVVANVYFLVISILQLATPWSPTNRYTTAGPLVIVLMVTMIKQGSEDLRRHQADEKQNNRTCTIVNDRGELETIPWKELEVGQILRVENGDELPADIVILTTSEEEGRCFIETCNLDGETNLKRRLAVKATGKLSGWRDLNQPPVDDATVHAGVISLKGTLEYEQPNNQLYNFTGRIMLENDNSTTPLGPENIMLRGCGLRSCAFVLGVVIFTGSETKLLQNSRSAPSKQSKLYRTANRCMLLIFTSMFVLCLASAIVAAIWSSHNHERLWYIPSVHANSAGDFIVNFFTFLILYNNFVPISLYVSLDIIKVIQARKITADEEIEHEGFKAIARTSEPNEELGQVEYIFSDKTGTLTCNIMEFRKCSIGGISYGFGTTEIGRAVAALQQQQAATKGPEVVGAAGISVSIENSEDVKKPVASDSARLPLISPKKPAYKPDAVAAQVHPDPTIHFDDPALLHHLVQGGKQAELIDEFLTLLSICHTVIPEVDKKTGAVNYRASSPDEEALVKAAKCLGYDFTEPAPITKVQVTLKQFADEAELPPQPTQRSYMILNVNEFNSSRKRMSVVVFNSKREYVLYCKGADNMMLPRSVPDEYTGKVTEHLKQFASEGLRTLVLGRRLLSEEEYLEYNRQYVEAATSLENREYKLDAVAEMIEKNMTIVGVTAIEDKLQEGGPGAIYDLAQAGIKIWVLTGDREETAVNIGHACRLINESMKLLYVNQEDINLLESQMDELHAAPAIQELLKAGEADDDLAMVCDGKALVHMFPSKDTVALMSTDAANRSRNLASKLLDVASCCKALIACRVSPSQKADIVNLVRKCSKSKPITLAIGDGANDVSMIQTAHVGIGICGKEGVQAVNASDYAIAQFRFLKRLLLVHGRGNYKRICKVIRYSFYKNISLVVSLFLFNFFNGQSGSPLFESFVMAGWNFFLATPIIVIGVFDEDLPGRVIQRYPKLYMKAQMDSDLNIPLFAITIMNSVVHALICFWVCYLCYNETHGLFLLGTIFYSALLMTMNLKVITLTLSWNKYHLIFLAFSVWLFFLFLIIYPYLTFLSFDMYGVTYVMFKEKLYWYLFFVCPIAACFVDFTYTTVKQQLYPTSEDILREKYIAGRGLRSPGADVVPDAGPDGSSRNASSAIVLPRQTKRTTSSAQSLSSGKNLRNVNGFAFNALDKEGGGQNNDMQELVTMHVRTFNNQQLESHRRTSLNSRMEAVERERKALSERSN